MDNTLFYCVVYHLYHAGNTSPAKDIFFVASNELDDDQIKNYISKKERLPYAAVIIHSSNKLSKQAYRAVGGSPFVHFQ